MPDYKVNLSGTAEVDDSIMEEFAQQILITHGEMGTADQFCSLKTEVGAKAINFTLYDRLSIDVTPIPEREEKGSEKLVDQGVNLIPAEYGKVVTKTSLATLQTGGKVDIAAAQLVGINMAQTENRLALLAADASTNVALAGGKAAVDDLVVADIITGDMANDMYRKLARASVPGLPQAMGLHVAIAHEDVLNDIRNESGFEDIKKYTNSEELAKNVVGVYKGFLWVRDNLSTRVVNANAAPAPVYNTYYLGFNALGKGTSLAPHMRVTGPFDDLARFVNIGWYGCFKYGIIQKEALWVSKTSASKNS